MIIILLRTCVSLKLDHFLKCKDIFKNYMRILTNFKNTINDLSRLKFHHFLKSGDSVLKKNFYVKLLTNLKALLVI